MRPDLRLHVAIIETRKPPGRRRAHQVAIRTYHEAPSHAGHANGRNIRVAEPQKCAVTYNFSAEKGLLIGLHRIADDSRKLGSVAPSVWIISRARLLQEVVDFREHEGRHHQRPRRLENITEEHEVLLGIRLRKIPSAADTINGIRANDKNQQQLSV